MATPRTPVMDGGAVAETRDWNAIFIPLIAREDLHAVTVSPSNIMQTDNHSQPILAKIKSPYNSLVQTSCTRFHRNMFNSYAGGKLELRLDIPTLYLFHVNLVQRTQNTDQEQCK
jgi:hypothetical protein